MRRLGAVLTEHRVDLVINRTFSLSMLIDLLLKLSDLCVHLFGSTTAECDDRLGITLCLAVSNLFHYPLLEASVVNQDFIGNRAKFIDNRE